MNIYNKILTLFYGLFVFAGPAFAGPWGGAIASWLINAAISYLVSYAINKLFGPDPKQQEGGGSGLLLNKNANDAYIPVLYGRNRIGGTRVYVNTTGGPVETGQPDHDGTTHLMVALAMCEGKMGPLEKVLFNDVVIWDKDHPTDAGTLDGDNILENYLPTTGGVCSNRDHSSQAACEADGETWDADGDLNKYNGDMIIQYFNGDDNQTVSSVLQDGIGSDTWTNDHRLRGIAYLALDINADADKFQGGVPLITAIIGGKRIANVSSLTVGDTSITTHVTTDSNPVDVLYDLLTSRRYGKHLEHDLSDNYTAGSDIDIASFQTARADCVTAGFKVNGPIQTDAKIFDNINQVLMAFNGMLVYTAGKYYLRVRKPNETSVMSFDTSTIIGEMGINAGNKRTHLNKITYNYYDPQAHYNKNSLIIENTANQTTDGDIFETKVDVELVNDVDILTKLGDYAIDSSRDQLAVTFTAPHTALVLECGEIIDITHELAGWSNELFRVEQLEVLADNTIKITAIHYDSSIQI